MTKSLAGANWNLKIARNPAQVVAEVAELFDRFDLDFLAGCEASGYVKPLAVSAASGALHDAGVRVLGYPDGDIPARETAILVRKRSHGGPGATAQRLHDITGIGWERDPSNRGMGLHPGRKSVSARIGFLRLLAVHTPPGPFGPGFPLRKKANLDAFAHQEAIAKAWHDEAHALQVGDWNRRPSDPVVRDLERATGWAVHGDGIDWSLGKGVTVTDIHRPHFGHSDHWPVLFTVSK